jgi:putative Mg2+ transporter-C (MgtC) family protein
MGLALDEFMFSDLGGDLERIEALAISAGLAALIGFERELARRPAGLRTHMLVGVAATLLMQLASLMAAYFTEQVGAPRISLDPIRILQAIIVGISFLGAGTIVHSNGARVEGLTTAASILLTAAIGVAVAIDRIALACAIAVGVALTLYLLGKLEDYFEARTPAEPPLGGAGDEEQDARVQSARRRAPAGSD